MTNKDIKSFPYGSDGVGVTIAKLPDGTILKDIRLSKRIEKN